MKYVVITGGVLSGLGKGVTASSIGLLLKAAGWRVTAIKIDPYLNTDAGTMSPFEHGEVFVLDDGGEVDLDLGNYERFLDVTLTRDNNLTTGKVYSQVIDAERAGDYLGRTVQVVPHVTDAVQEWLERVAKVPVDGSGEAAEVCVIELGGTVGDIESAPYVEALRQFQFRVGRENFCLVHVSLVPVMGVVGEQKTKPTQHSVRELMRLGLAPDFLVCRSEAPLEQETKDKLALFCHVPASHVISAHDMTNLYRVPLLLAEQTVPEAVCARLGMDEPELQHGLAPWRHLADRVDTLDEVVRIAIVGKYTGLADTYLSVIKALQHASYEADRKLVIEWIEATHLEPAARQETPAEWQVAWDTLRGADGVLVPGGFGERGVEGKILAAQYAREQQVPYLGICLGLQVAVIEFARHVLGREGANSTEMDEHTPHPVIVYMPEISRTVMGGTMRLGVRTTVVRGEESLALRLYGGLERVDERHRHRWEVNPDVVDALQAAGLRFTGADEAGQRMEILELADHPYFFATQYHPEFKSRPGRPSPPFLGLLLVASGQLEPWLERSEAVRVHLQ